jgi:chromosome segregation ATPase
MNLEARINEERLRAAEQLDELRKENERDEELLAEQKRRYLEAVTSQDSKAIDEVNLQIKEITERIQRRKYMIDALSDRNNPNIQRMISEKVAEWIERLKEIDKKAAALHQELMPQREKLLKGLAELNDLNNQAHRLKNTINHYNEQLNSSNRERLGLPKYGINGFEIYKYINPLLIERGNVYKL